MSHPHLSSRDLYFHLGETPLYRGGGGRGPGLHPAQPLPLGDQEGAEPGEAGGPALQQLLLSPGQHDDLPGGQLDSSEEREAEEILTGEIISICSVVIIIHSHYVEVKYSRMWKLLMIL